MTQACRCLYPAPGNLCAARKGPGCSGLGYECCNTAAREVDEGGAPQRENAGDRGFQLKLQRLTTPVLVRVWTPRASTRGWWEDDMVKLLSEAVGQFLVKTCSSVSQQPLDTDLREMQA